MATLGYTPQLDHLPPPYAPHGQDTLRSRDPETASILSQAPSYTSHTTELPAYDSIQPLGLPALRYAPGFTPATNDPFSAAAYTNSSSAGRRNPARRQYENVVSRRVEEERMATQLLGAFSTLVFPPLANVNEEAAESNTGNETLETGQDDEEFQAIRFVNSSLPRGAGAQTASSNRNMLLGYCPYVAPSTSTSGGMAGTSASNSVLNANNAMRLIPANPHEDPELVGQAAAERARSQRLYRETLLREMAAQNVIQQQQEAALFEGVMGPLSGVAQPRGQWSGFGGRHGMGIAMNSERQGVGRRGWFRKWSRGWVS
jgi:hypothetical protein